MNENDDGASTGRTHLPRRPMPEPTWDLRRGNLSPAIGVMLLLLELAPGLIRTGGFESIQGGLRLPDVGTDLLIDARRAGVELTFDDAQRLADITGNVTIMLYNSRLGVRAHISAPGAAFAMRDALLWSDMFDPQLRLVDGHPVAGRKWGEVNCITVHPEARPALSRPPETSLMMVNEGYHHAKAVVGRWLAKLEAGL